MTKKLKKVLAMLLAVSMVTGMLGTAAFAAESTDNTVISTEEQEIGAVSEAEIQEDEDSQIPGSEGGEDNDQPEDEADGADEPVTEPAGDPAADEPVDEAPVADKTEPEDSESGAPTGEQPVAPADEPTVLAEVEDEPAAQADETDPLGIPTSGSTVSEPLEIDAGEEDVTIEGVTFCETGLLTVNTTGKVTLTNCTFGPYETDDNGKVGNKNAMVILNAKSAEIKGNTFKGFFYNGLEFSQKAAYSLERADIADNTFENSIKHINFSFFQLAEGAEINISGTVMKEVPGYQNFIRISNYSNIDKATFNLSENTITFKDGVLTNQLPGLVLFQDTTGKQDFTGITLNITDLTYVDAKNRKPAVLVGVLDNNGQIFDNDPIITGDETVEEFFVASVHGRMFTTVQAAIDAADGKTVVLLQDHAESVTVAAGLDVTLDLNGQTLEGAILNRGTLTITGNGTVDNAKNENGWPAVENYGKLTVENGTYTAKDGSYALYSEGSDITIKGGTFRGMGNNGGTVTIEDGEFNAHADTDNISVVAALANWSGKVIVKGGTYTTAKGCDAATIENNDQMIISGGAVINYNKNHACIANQNGDETTPDLAITDGTFQGRIEHWNYNAPKISGGTFSYDVTEYCVKGSQAKEESADVWVIVPAEDSVAAIGNVGYATLQDAINAAEDGDEVLLLKDIPNSERVTINKAVTMTINLNGKSVGGGDKNATIMLNNKGAKVEIKNGSISGTATARGAVYVQLGEVVLSDVTVTSEQCGVGVGPGYQGYYGKATLNQGTTINGGKSGVSILGANDGVTPNSELTINEGVMITAKTFGIAGNGSWDGTEITINGGSVTANGGYPGEEDYSAGIYHPQQGTLNIKGGTISGKVGVQMAGGIAVIEGGKLVSTDTEELMAPYKTFAQTDGMVLDGAALSLVSRTAYGSIDVTVTNGTFEIANSANEAVRKYGMQRENGAWEVIEEPTDSVLKISGGVFDTEVELDHCAEGYVPIDNEDGTYTVIPHTDCDWDSGVVTTAPTYTTEGVRTYTCTVCGKTYTETIPVRQRPSTRPSTEEDEDLEDEDTPLSGRPWMFVDVAEEDWFYEAVKRLFDKEIVGGTTETTYEPYTDATRGMVATILYGMAGSPSVEGLEMAFSDVAESDYYYNAVLWAYENEVFSGYPDGTFKGEQAIQRQELVAVLHRYGVRNGLEDAARADLSGFVDEETIERWAREDVEWAVAEGIMSGHNGNRLAPLDKTNRAEMAILLSNFDKLLNGEEE